jgi:hypothetical protein
MAVKLSVRENAIERQLRERVEALGGECIKVTVIGRRGFFDRLVVLPGGRVIFVEVKRPRGGRTTTHQMLWHSRFDLLGLAIAVVKNSADIDALLKN